MFLLMNDQTDYSINIIMRELFDLLKAFNKIESAVTDLLFLSENTYFPSCELI